MCQGPRENDGCTSESGATVFRHCVFGACWRLRPLEPRRADDMTSNTDRSYRRASLAMYGPRSWSLSFAGGAEITGPSHQRALVDISGRSLRGSIERFAGIVRDGVASITDPA